MLSFEIPQPSQTLKSCQLDKIAMLCPGSPSLHHVPLCLQAKKAGCRAHLISSLLLWIAVLCSCRPGLKDVALYILSVFLVVGGGVGRVSLDPLTPSWLETEVFLKSILYWWCRKSCCRILQILGGINIKETLLKCLLCVARPLSGGEYRKVDIFQVRRDIHSIYIRLIKDVKCPSDEQKGKNHCGLIFSYGNAFFYVFVLYCICIIQFYGTQSMEEYWFFHMHLATYLLCGFR